MTASDSLYRSTRSYLRNALLGFGGGGEAWRQANPEDLLDALMATVQAGLSPKLEAAAIELAREFLATQRNSVGGEA